MKYKYMVGTTGYNYQAWCHVLVEVCMKRAWKVLRLEGSWDTPRQLFMHDHETGFEAMYKVEAPGITILFELLYDRATGSSSVDSYVKTDRLVYEEHLPIEDVFKLLV